MELSSDNLEKFRIALEKLGQELSAAVELGEDSTKPVQLDEAIGRVSRIDAYQHQQLAKVNQRALAARLARVKSALQRLEQEVYGECLECGEFISLARLNATPEATHCIECQQDRENFSS